MSDDDEERDDAVADADLDDTGLDNNDTDEDADDDFIDNGCAVEGLDDGFFGILVNGLQRGEMQRGSFSATSCDNFLRQFLATIFCFTTSYDNFLQ